jgi:hypothetical protein
MFFCLLILFSHFTFPLPLTCYASPTSFILSIIFCFIYFCINFFIVLSRSGGSSVIIVSDYRLDNRGSISGRGKRICPLVSVSRPALRPTHLPVQWVRDADHSPQCNAEVKNKKELYSSLPWSLHSGRGQLYFFFYYLSSPLFLLCFPSICFIFLDLSLEQY